MHDALLAYHSGGAYAYSDNAIGTIFSDEINRVFRMMCSSSLSYIIILRMDGRIERDFVILLARLMISTPTLTRVSTATKPKQRIRGEPA